MVFRKAIEEREKEAEIFYKSESSSDESGSEDNETKQTSCTDLEESSKIINGSSEVNSDGTGLENDFITEKSNEITFNSTGRGNFDEMTLDTNEVISDDKGNPNKSIYEVKGHSVGSVDSHIEELIDSETRKETRDKFSDATHIEGDILCKESVVTDESVLISDGKSSDLLEKDVIGLKDPESEQFSLKYSESESDPSNKEYNSDRTSMMEVEVNKEKLQCCDSKNNLVNTEEFSLKMSESQSEIENSSQKSQVVTVEESEIPLDKESNVNRLLENGKGVNLSCIEVESSGEKNSGEVLPSDTLVIEEKMSDAIHCKRECKKTQNGLNEVDLIKNNLNKKYNELRLNNLTDAPKMTVFDSEEIVLDEEVPKSGVNNLIERFFTHLSYKKKPAKKKAPLELR